MTAGRGAAGPVDPAGAVGAVDAVDAVDHYGVIGHPVAHSKSPEIHAAFARQTGQRIAYARCPAPLDGFAATVRALREQGYKGLNVTVPFKLEAADLADSLSARARAAGAVNTLLFSDAGIEGENTDGAGLVADIVDNAGLALAGRRILLLGAGGAARGALLPLLHQGPDQIVIANRGAASAHALAAHFGAHAGRAGQVQGCAMDAIDGAFDLVINATSASLAAAVPAVPAGAFKPGALALDMMYGREPTPFMAFAAGHGAIARDGLGMLVGQAAEAFYLWRGVRPDARAVLEQLRAQAALDPR
ncbi:shikimate dehydrogenase [Massilia glaciei]|uniref:Shikimate dehydrogenase (NADP(+)) n=1 Tax=Massilia glaciei TaxID=1524097 RepID=A0A2U2I688_9BURK|nr:shikimate dehydrogenase [Massilia glaciei]PWF55277.1 shikimate dehydrogenase [Massilia glaciei]